MKHTTIYKPARRRPAEAGELVYRITAPSLPRPVTLPALGGVA